MHEFRSSLLSCRSKVWAPILVVGDLVVPFALQRLSELLPSTAPLATKLEEAQNLCDSLAAKMLEGDSRNKTVSKMSEPYPTPENVVFLAACGSRVAK